MDFELNSQQKHATELSESWYKTFNKQTFEISGPAGSGKTSIVYYMIKKLGLSHEDVLFMAYVGKATMALARKGNNAKTIHSSIYDIIEVPKLNDEGIEMRKNGRIIYTTIFKLKQNLPDNIKLIVIDEGSMVNEQIALHVLSFGLPVLVLGDLNQLPPVFGKPYFLLKPDVILTEIMRQAKDDPIIVLSQMALKGEQIKVGKYGPMCFVIDKEHITDNMLIKSDIVICGKNKTRDNLNKYVRESILKIDKPYPIKGEKLICRQNKWDLSINENIFLINGLIGYVEDTYIDTFNKKSICIDFRPEFLENDYFEKLSIDYEFLFAKYEDKKDNKRSFYNKFEFAYALTTHLSQGSQYDKVLIYDEKLGDRSYYQKWLYTAITRAIKGLILAI